jgi:hypothetical protein
LTEEERLMGRPADMLRLMLLALAIAVVCVAMVLAGCSGDGSADSDSPEADALWEDIRGHSSTWDKAPGYMAMQPAEGPHGDDVLIFVNDEMAAALEGSGEDEWPVGSIVVKEFFERGNILGIVVMEKRADGRFWASYSPSGEVYDSGLSLETCEECHADGSDGVVAFSLP